MSLWTNTDNDAGKPKYLNTDDKSVTFGVGVGEAEQTENRAKGIRTPGWVKAVQYENAQGVIRNKVETLVAFGGNMSGDAADDLVIPDLAITIDTQPAATTWVVSPGTINITVEASVNGDAPLKYQWYDWDTEEKIAGQTSATLTLTDITAPRAFQVEVMAAGAPTVWSDKAEVQED